MEIDGKYKTSDLYTAAQLLSRRLKLKDIDRGNSPHCDFIFENRAHRRELVDQSMCGSATSSVAEIRSLLVLRETELVVA